jgi:hypothetical protein
MTDTGDGMWANYEAQPDRAPRGRRIAVGLGVIAVVAGGLFAVLSLGSESNSPEDPVRAMFEAAERGDLLGVLEQLDPGERDTIRQPLLDIADELDRLEVLKDPDLGGISGIDLQVDDLQLDSRRVFDDVARVSITDGKGRIHVDVSDLPLGPFVRDLLGEANNEVADESESLASEDADDFVATVRRDGKWYVSIGYSIAEQARGGTPFEQLGASVTARGADTPDGAVREMLEAGAALDVRRVLELLSPEEFGAAQDYAGLFLPGLESEIAGVRDEVGVSIATLDLEAETDGDQSLVTIKKIEAEGHTEFNAFSFRDGCFKMSGEDVSPTELCPEDRPTDALGLTPFGFFGARAGDVEPPQLSFADKQAPVGFVTTRVAGKWYVSPVRTVLVDLVAIMRLVQRSDLDAIRDYFDRLSASFSSGFEESYTCYAPGSDGGSTSAQSDCAYGELQGGSVEEHRAPAEPEAPSELQATTTTYLEQ